MLKRPLIVVAIAVLCLASWIADAKSASSKMNSFPTTSIWAWQRPEKLNFLDSQKTAVAVLAETIWLSPVKFEPRTQPISAPPESKYIAVVRIQAPQNSDLSETTRSRVVEEIRKYADRPHTRAVQIDFDATVSQRDYYRALLQDLRARLPNEMPISITALVSWCEGDDWISSLPIDEAVPMYFRMGSDNDAIRRSHMDVRGLHEPLCRTSVGISLDEPWPRFDYGVRVYAFAPTSWTETDYRRMLERLAR